MTEKDSTNKWRLGATALVMFLASLNDVGAVAPQPPPLDSILERMAAAYRSLKSLAAELEQVKSYPQLGLDDPPERGTVHVKRKKPDDFMLRLEIFEPERRIVTVTNDGGYVLYQPKIKQAIEGKVGNNAGGRSGTSFMRYLLGDLSTARKDYDIVSLGEEVLGRHETVHLRLTAKGDGQGYYPRIDLWVDQSLWLPVEQELVEPNRSVTRLRFTAFQINEELDDSLFTVKLPPDVERVRG